MAGRTEFSRQELAEIRAPVTELRLSDENRQKAIRAGLRRRLGFYITDWKTDQQGFTVSDLDELVRSGSIRVRRDLP